MYTLSYVKVLYLNNTWTYREIKFFLFYFLRCWQALSYFTFPFSIGLGPVQKSKRASRPKKAEPFLT